MNDAVRMDPSAKPIKTDTRPWGMFEQFNQNSECTVKLIHVKASKRLSLQYHNHREEYWRIISGRVRVTIGDMTTEAGPGESFHVPLKTRHRLEGVTDATLLEIAKGRFDEDDIVRIEDDFGRK
ncbi:MAG: phosphomannose isomerase type II C-terminal cupin domain [Candidatus Micrarchaeota archaeon]|nr:phosphomannose isomerase type II C-terminal cupin domain [Candidatus Micrarchaeota archaeon]